MKLHSDYINEPLDSHGTNRHSMWLQLNNIGFRKNINSTEDLLGSQYVLQLIWRIYKRWIFLTFRILPFSLIAYLSYASSKFLIDNLLVWPKVCCDDFDQKTRGFVSVIRILVWTTRPGSFFSSLLVERYWYLSHVCRNLIIADLSGTINYDVIIPEQENRYLSRF